MYIQLQRPQIDRNSSIPLHRQVEDWLRLQIESGVLTPGATLPPRKEFCELLGGINHLTIRQAVSALIREGLLVSVQGRGTFVAEPQQRQLRIGLVLPCIDDGITRSIVDGVHESLAAHSNPPIRLVLFDSRKDARKEIENIAQLEDLPLDGAIVLPVSYGDLMEHLLRLKIDRFPLVLVDSEIPEIDIPSVNTDNYDGGYQLVSHLLKCGHRNLAWIGNCKGYYSARQRLEGFRDALNDAGVPYNRKWFFEHQQESPMAPFEDSMRKIVGRIVGEKMPIDAIVCADDGEAISCIRLLKEQGVAVPDQIAVTGFDDIVEASLVAPALTTIRRPMRQLGSEAVRILLEVIANPASRPASLKIPVSLVRRESA